MENRHPYSATLLIYCQDRRGIIASVTDFVHEHEGNIIYLDQYVDAEENVFYMRIEWDLENFVISTDKIDTLFINHNYSVSRGKYFRTKVWNQ